MARNVTAMTTTAQFTRKSIARLLQEAATAAGRDYSASCVDTGKGPMLEYRLDGVAMPPFVMAAELGVDVSDR